MVTQEVRERYGDEASAGATVISQNRNEFTEAAANFDAAILEESAVRAQLQREINLTDHATGAFDERDEDKTEEYAVRNCSHPERNRVEHATG